jgi:flagellar motor component MotA
MLDLYVRLNPVFSRIEKDASKSVIETMFILANISRQDGVVSLANQSLVKLNTFLKMSFRMLIDGLDPSVVKDVLKAVIISGGYTGSELLKRLLMAEGVLSIQMGESPEIIKLKLCAMLGEEYVIRMAK